jgi:hypothetical protein
MERHKPNDADQFGNENWIVGQLEHTYPLRPQAILRQMRRTEGMLMPMC